MVSKHKTPLTQHKVNNVNHTYTNCELVQGILFVILICPSRKVSTKGIKTLLEATHRTTTIVYSVEV